MLDPKLFTPLPAAARHRIADDYIAFALARDGEPNVKQRTLARREAFFRELAERPAPAWDGEPIGQADFTRWHVGERPLLEAPPLIVWLVRIARAQEGEGWGVEYLLDRGGFDGLGQRGRLRPRDFADLEEVYHTRIMHEVVRLFGVDFKLRVPPWSIQQPVKLMAHLPQRASYLLLLAGELMGTVAFCMLATKGERLLTGHPSVQERVRLLLDEILVDEIGHVTFLLGSMTAWELAIIRQLAVMFSNFSRRGYYGDDLREVMEMQEGIRNYSLAIFPERVLRRAFVPHQYWPDALGPAPVPAA